MFCKIINFSKCEVKKVNILRSIFVIKTANQSTILTKRVRYLLNIKQVKECEFLY